MTETIDDKDEIADLAYQILEEEGEITMNELMTEFRVHDTDAQVTAFWEALNEDSRIEKVGESESWRISDDSR